MKLELRELRVSYAGKSVLGPLRANFVSGGVVGVIGPPASGKSVLLKTLAGLVEHARGEVVVDGTTLDFRDDSSLRHWRGRIGMSFQNDALFDARTLFENVAFPLRREGVHEGEIDRRVGAVLDRVGLAHAAQKLPAEVSGGMRKRCGIARAWIRSPELGLYDDPTAGLDPLTADQIFELVVTPAKSSGALVIVVSNDLPSLLPVCDEVLVLHEGQVVFAGNLEGLQASEVPVVRQFVRGAEDGPL